MDERGEKRHPARRWVVERTLAWLSKCRAILVRYDKKAKNYLVRLRRIAVSMCTDLVPPVVAVKSFEIITKSTHPVAIAVAGIVG